MADNKKTITYTLTLTEQQARVVQNALEEYFRLRMGQGEEFCRDLAEMGHDLRPDHPRHEEIFNAFIHRRNHMQEIMRAVFRIAFEPYVYCGEKTDDMMIAECVWDSLRFERGQSKWSSPLQIGPEPCPKIERREE